VSGDFITVAEGAAGLRFTPTAGLYSPGNTFGFTVQGALDNTGSGLSSPATGSITVNPKLDYGDAPDPSFPSLAASDGARHVVLSTGATIYLGSPPDTESDALINATASGDTDDGVTFPGTLTAGNGETISIVASGAGFVNAWIDFNRDGDWADAGEQILMDKPVVAGPNAVVINIPPGAAHGSSFARFRITSSNSGGALSYTGQAVDGEVEDYQVTLNAPPVPGAHTIVRHANEDTKVQATTLLATDTDADGDTLSIIGVVSPTGAGASVVLSGGWIYYTHAGITADVFTYTVSDGKGGTAIGTVNVTIGDPDAQSTEVLSISYDAGGAHISFDGIPGRIYIIQSKDLVGDPWVDRAPASGDALGRFTFTDPTGGPTRFYRSVYRE
jgi:hypothetical protein